MLNHSKLICNQKKKFQCAECRMLTSAGYQLIGAEETRFVCRDCFLPLRNQFPMKGKSLKQLIPADLALSTEYDPDTYEEEVEGETEALEEEVDNEYVGELILDEETGEWRIPTPEEIQAMNSPANTPLSPTDTSTLEIKYRFTTDNKLQVILPRRCKIDQTTYELIVTTEGS